MTAVGTLTIIWRGGEHQFCLAKVGEIFALEETCKAGIGEIIWRLNVGHYRLNDIRETIRLGLIGGGMDPERAMVAVKLHVDGNPNGLAASVIIAKAILAAVQVGVPDDPLGKADAAEPDPTSSTMMDGFAAASSMASVQDLDGHPEKPITQRSGNLPPLSMVTTAPTAEPTANPRH